MTTKTIRGLTSAFILLGTLAVVGCGEAERTYDCAQICDTYSDCVDDSIDKGDCVDRCEDKGQEDPDFEAQADECEACLDDKSCTEAALQCTTACAAVVAEST